MIDYYYEKTDGGSGGHIAIPAMRLSVIPGLRKSMFHGEPIRYALIVMGTYMILTLLNGRLNVINRHII